MQRVGGEDTGMPTSIRGALAPLIATALFPAGGTTLIVAYVAAVCALLAEQQG